MAQSAEMKEFEMPLHLQLAMRKAELEANEMTWDQLVVVLLNLYHQRLLEIQAVKDLLEEEGIEINFDIPSDIELAQLAMAIGEHEDDDEIDDEGECQPF
jgi:predicted protein tyrosine phosphatase